MMSRRVYMKQGPTMLSVHMVMRHRVSIALLPAVLRTRQNGLRSTLGRFERHQSTHHQNGSMVAAETFKVKHRSVDLPPHALMPTSMLLRAALVSAVTSNPGLLKTALRFLTYLTSTKSRWFRPEKNWIVHFILKQTFYNHFCAGENGVEVTDTIAKLKRTGFKGVILTYAREIVIDSNLEEKGKGAVGGTSDTESVTESESESESSDIATWKDGVLLTVGLLGQDDFLALKLTGGGASVMSSLSSTQTISDEMAQALQEVCSAAIRRKVRILVDAEQQSIQQGIDAVALDLMRKYNSNSDEAVVYNTYQAYLKSTPETLSSHIKTAQSEGFAVGVKLVRGAYMASEPRHLIHDTKEDTDAGYDGIAKSLLTQSPISSRKSSSSPPSTNIDFPPTSLFLATRNKSSALAAHRHYSVQKLNHRPTVTNLQHGQLLGMADAVSCSLLQMGRSSSRQSEKEVDGASSTTPQVYKCLSWGPLPDCLSYLTRRARENQDAVGRSTDERKAVWTEIRRRMRKTLVA